MRSWRDFLPRSPFWTIANSRPRRKRELQSTTRSALYFTTRSSNLHVLPPIGRRRHRTGVRHHSISARVLVVAVSIAAVVPLGVLFGQIEAGSITPQTTFAPFAALITAAGFGMTYLSFRDAHDDRRLAARPFLWCVCKNTGRRFELRLENDNENPALGVRVYVAATMPDKSSRVSQDGASAGRTGAPPLHVRAHRWLGAIAPRYVVHTSFDIVEPCDIHVFVLYSTHLGDDALSYFHYSEADLSSRRAPTLPEASHGAEAPLELIRVEISPLRPGTRGDEGAPQEALAILFQEAQLSRLGGRPREIIDDLHRDSTGERYTPDESDYGWTQRPLANTKGD